MRVKGEVSTPESTSGAYLHQYTFRIRGGGSNASAFLVDREEGYALTCYHAVRGAPKDSGVQLVAEELAGEALSARLVRDFSVPSEDLAVLKVVDQGLEMLREAQRARVEACMAHHGEALCRRLCVRRLDLRSALQRPRMICGATEFRSRKAHCPEDPCSQPIRGGQSVIARGYPLPGTLGSRTGWDVSLRISNANPTADLDPPAWIDAAPDAPPMRFMILDPGLNDMGARILPGMSGGPVLHNARFAVCGLACGYHMAQQKSLALPLSGLHEAWPALTDRYCCRVPVPVLKTWQEIAGFLQRDARDRLRDADINPYDLAARVQGMTHPNTALPQMMDCAREVMRVLLDKTPPLDMDIPAKLAAWRAGRKIEPSLRKRVQDGLAGVGACRRMKAGDWIQLTGDVVIWWSGMCP